MIHPTTADRIRVTGPQAESYLQGQLSQDVASLAPGAGTESLLLEPTGKMGFWLQVERTDAGFVLAVDAGQGEAVLERLTRFKLRTKVDFDLEPAAAGGGAETGDETLARVMAGRPRHGAEIVAGETIPAELGQHLVDASVSFTKGCYTGQELVARIDSRGGNVPRHLRRVTFDAPDPSALPAPGTELVADGKVVGRLTSVTWSGERHGGVALGYVARAIDVPATLELAGVGPGVGPADVRGLRED